MSRKPNTNDQNGPLVLPNQVPTIGEPQQSAVIITTEDGKRLAFPQVAVAMLSPDVIKVLAEAIWQRINNPQAFFASMSDAPAKEVEAGDELESDNLVTAG